MAATATAISTRQLWQFPNETMIENIAVRPNGRILFNTFVDARMYTLDPRRPCHPVIAAQIPGKTALTGIAEVAPDKFAVGAGILGNFAFADNSSSIWLVDFAKPTDLLPASVSWVANVPEAAIFNGIVALPKYPHVVLTSDSIKGTIYRIDTTNGKVDVAFADPKLAIGSDPLTPLGINGMKIYDGYLYFAQSAQGYFGRLRISDKGDKIGPIEKLATVPAGSAGYDDFAMTKHGVSYVTDHPYTVTRIAADGTQTELIGAGNVPKLYNPTSAALNRDETKLYIVTDGATLSGGTTGGQVIEVDLR
ncbi:hypothetical protein CHU98_g2895 [Xylaria longipes]|nr:hypothetical protein CHU98_g2895 [Xylaria longipes]